MLRPFLLTVITVFFLYCPISAFAQDSTDAANPGEASLAEINRALENPLSRFWSLIFQENLMINEGELIEDQRITNSLFFQPSLPVPIGQGKMLLVRPVFPLVTAPRVTEEGIQEDNITGYGDMQVFSMYGPDKKDGIIWGAGLTFTFPTASSPELGAGKYQMGPAAMALRFTKKWTGGILLQHWEDVGGDPERPATDRTDLQYIIRRQIPSKAMSIGMGPTIVYDWEAPEGNQLIFPVGLGITKTMKWGKTPYKVRFEPQYNIVRPEDFGAVWNIRLQIAPVIKNALL